MPAIKGFSLAGGGRLALVAGAHVLVIYLIATSLGIVDPPTFAPPMEATLIADPKPTEPVKPEIAQPELVEPTLEIPQPDTIPVPQVEIPVDVSTSAAVSASPEAVESAELAVTSRTQPNYPAQSKRLGEEGMVILRVLVDEKGRPLQVNVMKSSGFPRLDESAAKAIRRWVFAPAKRAGQPVRSWSRVQVRFQLENA